MAKHPSGRARGRRHDIVLLGATGFTGALTAEYLAANAPPDCRWAIAGRNPERLETLRRRLTRIDEGLAELPCVRADIDDRESLRMLAESSRLLMTTVGPYIEYGEPVVAACAAAGTDYVDLAGEPEFVDSMYVRHHATALETGARLVHACGFDSIPHDLGVYFTVGQLPDDTPIHVDGYVRAGGRPSGGTVHSALSAFSRRQESRRAAAERRALEERPTGRRARGVTGLPGRAKGLNLWALPLPTIDPQIVVRSARALDRYGPDFTYSHFAAARQLPNFVATAAGAVGVVGVAQIGPARDWLLGRIEAGDGPSASQRAKSWFKVNFVGEAGEERVITEVSGGDPGYGETSKMLGESALCLAFDDNPATAGQVTTAVAMADALTERLIRAGLRFRVVEAELD